MESVDRLIKHVETTKKSRFNASRRTLQSHFSSMLCISFLSLFIICINLCAFLPYNRCMGAELEVFNSVSTILSIILSTFVLVLSVIVFSLNYNVRGNNYHSCGVDLTRLEDRIRVYRDFNKDCKEDDIKMFMEEYHTILKLYNLNHRRIDYLYHNKEANGQEENGEAGGDKKASHTCLCGLGHKLGIWIRWNMGNDSFIYWLLLIAGASALAFMIAWRIRLM